MMNHEQYRRAVLANPLGTDAELEAHRASCEDCRAFTDGVLTFEHRLARALKVSTPIRAKILPFGTRIGSERRDCFCGGGWYLAHAPLQPRCRSGRAHG
jgi:hypothetical protein